MKQTGEGGGGLGGGKRPLHYSFGIEGHKKKKKEGRSKKNPHLRARDRKKRGCPGHVREALMGPSPKLRKVGKKNKGEKGWAMKINNTIHHQRYRITTWGES